MRRVAIATQEHGFIETLHRNNIKSNWLSYEHTILELTTSCLDATDYIAKLLEEETGRRRRETSSVIIVINHIEITSRAISSVGRASDF
ncbi:hypothetical protein KH400_21675 [Desertibacillus haloalkaliphilus]|nr:hypothetical protein [Desertibacillus haloalkaliphilus]